MKSMMTLAAATAATIMILATPAGAEDLVNMTFTGTVEQISDPSGLLGSAKPGDSYVLTYTADLSKAAPTYDGGFDGGDAKLTGGSSLAPQDTIPSPISATLSIDGGPSLNFAGAFLGSMTYIYNAYDAIIGSGSGFSSADFTVKDQVPGGLSDDIGAHIGSDQYGTFDVDVNQPMSLAIDGVHVTSQPTAFSYAGDSNGKATSVTGTLDPSTYAVTVSGAPEPRGWVLLILGVGMIGAGLRFNARRAATAAHRFADRAP